MRADLASPACERLLQLAVHYPAEVAVVLGARDPDAVFLDGVSVRVFVRLLTNPDAAPMPSAMAALGGDGMLARVAWIRLLPCAPPFDGEVAALVDAMEAWCAKVADEANVLADVLGVGR